MPARTEPVRLISFGDGTFESSVSERPKKIRDVLREHRVETNGRRLALNGIVTSLEAIVVEGDQITCLPRVEGG